MDGNAVDSVGSADGTVNGTTTVAGEVGNGLAFDESISDYVELPDVTYNSEFTISFEFKVDEIDGLLFQYLFSHGDINNTNSISIFINEASHGTDPDVLRTVVRDGDDTLDNAALQVDISASGLNLVDSQFHTYTLTSGSEGVQVYIDGVLAASDATRGTDGVNPTGNAHLGIREDLSAGHTFGGVLDSVQIYDNALIQGQVTDLNAGVNRGTVNLTVVAANQAPYFTSISSADPQSVESLTGATSVSSGDFDNDGDVDLVSTTNTGELRWHENDGTGSFSAGVLIASAQNFTSVAVYDLEGDGDMDIVAMNDDPADTANSVFVLTNNFIGSGTVSFATQSFEGSGVGESDGGRDLAIGDIDGDGRADIAGIFFRNIGDSQVVVFEQNAVGIWTKAYTDAISNGHGIELVDLDGDTDLDIVTGDFQSREINWYENDGNATAGYSKQLVYNDVTEQIFDVTVGDFDADGDVDIAYVTWGATDKIVMLKNDGAANPSFTYSVVATETGALLYRIETSDTNGDERSI